MESNPHDLFAIDRLEGGALIRCKKCPWIFKARNVSKWTAQVALEAAWLHLHLTHGFPRVKDPDRV